MIGQSWGEVRCGTLFGGFWFTPESEGHLINSDDV